MENYDDTNQNQNNKIVSEDVHLEETSSISKPKGRKKNILKRNNYKPSFWSVLIIIGIALAGLVFLGWLTSKRENNTSQVNQNRKEDSLFDSFSDYDVGYYRIAIPNTMQMSDDHSWDMDYCFKTKDVNDPATIQIRYDCSDYSEVVSEWNSWDGIPEEVGDNIKEAMCIQFNDTPGIKVTKVFDPNFVEICGNRALHMSFHCLMYGTDCCFDQYMLFSPDQYTNITVSYRFADVKKWSVLNKTVREMKRIGEEDEKSEYNDGPNKEVQEYVRNLDDAFRSNKNLTKEEMKGSFVPISAKLESSNDGDIYIVLGTIDCFDGDASFLTWSKSEATYNDMKAAHKKDWSGRIEGSEGMMYTAFEGNCGFALRLYNYERTDSCTFYYGKDEVAEMYREAKGYVGNGGESMANASEGRFDIGDYTIEIPESMYLSGDQSFDIVYNFWTKDESKYARIQVKIEDVENASKIAELFNEGWVYTKEEAEEFRRDIMKQCNEEGMNVSNMEGPDFVMIDGDRIFHSAMVRNTPVPTRVDDYQLYSKNKKYIITTSYRVKDRNEWEGVLRRSVRSIRKK